MSYQNHNLNESWDWTHMVLPQTEPNNASIIVCKNQDGISQRVKVSAIFSPDGYQQKSNKN